MDKVFEIYRNPRKGPRALKRGFCWPAFFFGPAWALHHRLWLPGLLLAGALVFLAAAWTAVGTGQVPFVALLWLCVAVAAGVKAYGWRLAAFERGGFEYLGALRAKDTGTALSRVAMAAPFDETLKYRGYRVSLAVGSSGFRRLVAMALLTVKAAFRYKLVVVLTTLLLLAVAGLPLVIKHDGTARGFTQILLTYTLGSMTALLGFATLWVACGTLARDVEECVMQTVAVKPIPRWQIWFGKWLGIMLVNAMLMSAAGATVYGLVLWRSKQLKPAEQETLHKQVLVGRGSLKEPLQDLWPTVELNYPTVIRENQELAKMDPAEVKKALHQRLRAEEQVVRPNFRRRWMFNLAELGLLDQLRDKPLRLRVKFHSSQPTVDDVWTCVWLVGPPEDEKIIPKRYEMRVQAGSFHEFDVAPNLFDNKGVLTIEYWNYNDRAMLFPLEDGLEVLYPECGFGLNFTRGLAIIFLWMGLLAAIGLAAGSYLTFPVAAFASLSVLIVGLSSSVMAEVIKDKTIYQTAHEGEIQAQIKRPLDRVMVPVFTGLYHVIRLAQDFSPVDSLSTGRSISWMQLLRAFGQVGVLMTGIFAVTGVWLFYRRELATAQSQP